MGVECLVEGGWGWKGMRALSEEGADSQFSPKAQVNGISSRKHNGFNVWQFLGRLNSLVKGNSVLLKWEETFLNTVNINRNL